MCDSLWYQSAPCFPINLTKKFFTHATLSKLMVFSFLPKNEPEKAISTSFVGLRNRVGGWKAFVSKTLIFHIPTENEKVRTLCFLWRLQRKKAASWTCINRSFGLAKVRLNRFIPTPNYLGRSTLIVQRTLHHNDVLWKVR